MTERPLCLLGDPVLRTPCDPVVRLQHQTKDHLPSELFIDRLDPAARGAVMRKIANLA